MIPEKAAAYPAYTARTVRRSLSLYAEKEGTLFSRGVNVKEEGGALCVAEGVEFLYELPENTVKLVSPSGTEKRAWAYTSDGGLYALDESRAYANVPPFSALTGAKDEENRDVLYAVAVGSVYALFEGRAEKVSGAVGGDAACIACERLLSAKGDTVRFSAPLAPKEHTRGIGKAGFVTLPSKDGDILFLEEAEDVVLIVRDSGLWTLTARGDETKFVAEQVPFSGGKIKRGSCAFGGGKIYFLAEDGLYRFEKGGVKLLPSCGFFEIDMEKEVEAVYAAGKYCASVYCRDGEKRLYLFDEASGRGHFLSVNAELLAGGETLLFASGGKLFELSENGFPAEGREECAIWTEKSLLGLSPRKKFLDGVTVEGEGSFLFEARSEKGARAMALGRAGERLRFPVPLFGTSFCFHITSSDPRMRLYSLILELREEAAKW